MSELISKCCGAEAVPIRTYHYANTIDMKQHIAHDPQYGCTKCHTYCEVEEKDHDEKWKNATIEDCLKFLSKTNFRNLSIQINPISSEVSPNVPGFRHLYWEGKTPLEALLKAVLEILKRK